MADGCIGTGRHHYMVQVHLNQRDAGHLHKLANFLGSSNKIHENNANSGYSGKTLSCAFGFSSRKIVEKLAYLGVVPQKSTKEKVHSSLAFDRDFWRGAVDGDGSVFVTTKGPKGRQHEYPFVQLCGSVDLVAQFSDYIEKLVGARPTMHFARTMPFVCISSLRAQRVISELYSDCCVALDRKLESATKCLAWVPRRAWHCAKVCQAQSA